MSLTSRVITAFEAAPLPDAVRRGAVKMLVGNVRRQMRDADAGATQRFAEEMARFPVAQHADLANAQHYEVPAEFFRLCLGPRFKYSSCLYTKSADTLADAEVRALHETCQHADLHDGQAILELGCGWGSLSLWMAEHYPNAKITSVSNSASQRAHIEAQAKAKGFANLRVITADMNDFAIDQRFDRVVSVEMFEHMSNWRELLTRCKGWLKPEGKLFLHVFAHRAAPYRFDVNDPTDWIAQHFFAGGVMPSRDLVGAFPDLFKVDQQWWWNGGNYARTAEDWLKNFDANREAIRRVLSDVYGRDARLWEHRWRLFFLATAGLFGHADGEEWGVTHALMSPS